MKLDSKLEADRKVIPKWNLSAKTIRLDLHRGRRSLLGQGLMSLASRNSRAIVPEEKIVAHDKGR
jgi:hypothetical protein